uniref:Uncharacterized protein n=1 Tax=Nelumbo nucifera TaxID=4432 RepID=A0A822ZPC9_NELNU|nr:TPA_asm: hypothetical protein HUJ06_001878 [Nelumbo nucifera]
MYLNGVCTSFGVRTNSIEQPEDSFVKGESNGEVNIRLGEQLKERNSTKATEEFLKEIGNLGQFRVKRT